MPHRLSERLLSLLQPGRESTGKRGKFPAYYKWCRGPSGKQVERLCSTGFEIDEWTAYFGQPDYVEKVPLLRELDAVATRTLVQHPVKALTSYARVLLTAR